MVGAVLVLLILMVSVFVGVNSSISSGMKTGYFVVITLFSVCLVVSKLI